LAAKWSIPFAGVQDRERHAWQEMVKKSVAMVYPMSLAETPSGLGKGPVWVSSSLHQLGAGSSAASL